MSHCEQRIKLWENQENFDWYSHHQRGLCTAGSPAGSTAPEAPPPHLELLAHSLPRPRSLTAVCHSCHTSALAPDGGLADKHDFYKSGQFSKENSNRRRRSSLSVCLRPAVCTAPLTPTKPMDTLRLLGNVRRRAATNTRVSAAEK